MSEIVMQNLEGILLTMDEMLLNALSERHVVRNLVFHVPKHIFMELKIIHGENLAYKNVNVIEDIHIEDRIILWDDKNYCLLSAHPLSNYIL